MQRLTAGWYREVLSRLPPGSRILDIGIGTAGPLLANAGLLETRDLRVVGVDIDESYIKRARKRIGKAALGERVQVHHQSIMDHRDGPYDAAYFAASFMLMPDPPAALRHVGSLLGSDGRIFFTQTFQERPSRLVERAKPLLKLVTTIDFGSVTYLDDFRATVQAGGVELEDLCTLTESRDKARTYRLAIGRPTR